MKQFILNDEPDNENNVRLTGSDYHYLVRVRRYAVGEFFPALLPDSKETQIQIISIDDGVLTGKCIFPNTGTIHRDDAVHLPPILLFQALPKIDKMDLIVRQAAEGGITEIVPFVSDFSIAKVSADGKKVTRWEHIIKEARQQSGSRIATAIRQPVTFDALLKYWQKLKCSGAALGLLFHHLVLEQKSLHGYLNSKPDIAVLAVGPEGGFSEREVSLFLENGFKPFTIGDTILRTETAALYCSAAVRILLLEKDLWEQKRTL